MTLKNILGLIAMLVSISAQAVNLQISWVPPTQRTDNSALGANDVIGYEIRYRKDSEGLSALKTVMIPDGKATKYVLTVTDDVNYVVSIAAYDTTFLYSAFAQLTYVPIADLPSPKLPTTLKVIKQPADTLVLCTANPTKCKIAAPSEWQ
jgi:hypothetical protein